MKNLIYTLATMLCFTLGLQANILSVNNLGGAPYTNIRTAYDAAVDGDTIYIEPTDIDYGNLTGGHTMNKRLTLVGVGYAPGNEGSKKSIVNDVRLAHGATGSRFYGIVFNRLDIDPSPNGPVDSILVENCLIKTGLGFHRAPSRNTVLRYCVFQRIQYSAYIHDADSAADKSTVSFLNCVFNGGIYSNRNDHNIVVVDHCILNRLDEFTDELNGALIKNSFFFSGQSGTAGGSGNIFLNNIIRGNGALGLANSGANNQFNTSMSFVSYNGFSSWSASYDYHLLPGSNGIGGATDSTDIGIHGGNSTYSNSGEPLWLPIVRFTDFQGAAIPNVQPGDTLKIQINASRPAFD